MKPESGPNKAESGDRKPERKEPGLRADFKNRTFRFGIRCVRLVETLPKSIAGGTVGKQLVRAATSVGANYRGAVRGRSRGDFLSRMGIVEKECDEALYWIDVLVALDFVSSKSVEELGREANEIVAITVSSIKTARRNAQK